MYIYIKSIVDSFLTQQMLSCLFHFYRYYFVVLAHIVSLNQIFRVQSQRTLLLFNIDDEVILLFKYKNSKVRYEMLDHYASDFVLDICEIKM
jgi:hypothetical protein